MKRNYYLVLDVETANSTDDALVYDLGFAIADQKGRIYEAHSYLVSDIFEKEADLMQSAYYAEKIPQYLEGIEAGDFQVLTFYEARRILLEVMKKWDVVAVAAYNANFDTTALNTTERWLTKSKYRYFFPYGTQIYCIWHMACQLICTQSTYIRYCHQNGLVSPAGNIKTSAEAVYGYISGDHTFDESHTGLQDVLIESQIMAKCFAQHKRFDKSINRLCWRIPQKKAKEFRTR